MPRITDANEARGAATIALLSAVIHAGRDDGDLVYAIAAALSTLPEERATVCFDDLMKLLSEAAANDLEKNMPDAEFEWKSKWALNHQATGRAQGRQEGREALCNSLLAILEARGLATSPEERARIAECSELATLARWVQRAATATSLADVFAE